MKIVHVLQWFELGGGESLALRLAAWQRSQGHQVVAVGLSSGPLAEEFGTQGVQVEVHRKKPGFDATLYPRLLAAFRGHRAAVVHLHDQQSLVYAAAPARIAGARVICTKHGETVESARRLMLRRLGARFVHAFVAVSESTANTARRQREVSSNKLQVVPNGVDVKRFRPDRGDRASVRQELGLDDDTWIVGTVGRQAPEKNPTLLLEAVAPLLDSNSHVVFVGAGELSRSLEQMAGQLPAATSVHLLGPRRDVARLLAGIDVFALSSQTEGLPLVVLEAMATGLPIVSTAVGGIAAVIRHEQTGLLVPPGDGASLRAALKRLASERECARMMGTRGRRVVSEDYSFDAMAKRYMTIYLERSARLQSPFERSSRSKSEP